MLKKSCKSLKPTKLPGTPVHMNGIQQAEDNVLFLCSCCKLGLYLLYKSEPSLYARFNDVHALFHSNLSETPSGRCYFYPHFGVVETEAKRV